MLGIFHSNTKRDRREETRVRDEYTCLRFATRGTFSTANFNLPLKPLVLFRSEDAASSGLVHYSHARHTSTEVRQWHLSLIRHELLFREHKHPRYTCVDMRIVSTLKVRLAQYFQNRVTRFDQGDYVD